MAPAPRSVEERLYAKAVAGPNGCIVWTAAKTPNGYGKFQLGVRKTGLAHRIAYELKVGPVPAGLHLDHLCRNRLCINHWHLEPVTCKENLMRGEGPPALNAAKTHCPQGHPYSGSNLITSGGRRACRTCKNGQKRLRRAAQKGA